MNNPTPSRDAHAIDFLGTSTLPELGGKTVSIYQWVRSREFIVGSGHPVSTDDPPRGRADLSDLQPGLSYRHSDSDWIVRFLGTARMEELRGEIIGICRVVDREDVFIILTLHGYRLGERLTPQDDSE